MINEQMTSEEVIKKLEELCEYKGYNYAVITDKDVEALHMALEILRNEKPKGKWKVVGRNTQNNIWHLFCPKCNCDMFTEFTSYCPKCGQPMEEIDYEELDMRGDKE